MKHKILCSIAGALLLLAATAALALAWPGQPPDRVLISGPGIEGQAEVRDQQARAIFRLGNLEDLDVAAPAPPKADQGYKIVRFFYDGEFDFARLTYYPDPSGGRGYLYWEDGPMLEGDHTAYNQTWLYARPDAEKQLAALLKQVAGSGAAGANAPNWPSPAAIALLAGAAVLAAAAGTGRLTARTLIAKIAALRSRA